MKRALPGAEDVSSSNDAFSEVLQEAVNHFTVSNFSEAAAAMVVDEEFIERGRKAAAFRNSRRAETDYHLLETWWINIPGSASNIQTRVMRALFLRIMTVLLDEWLTNAPLSLFTGCQKWLLGVNYESLADFQAAAEANELENTICALLLDAACAVVRLYHPVTPKILRQAGGAADNKRPRFEEKAASLTAQGNFIVKALRLEGVPEANKTRALKILLILLRANLYSNLVLRPGFGNCLTEVGAYCREICLSEPNELACDLYVLSSWRNGGSADSGAIVQDCLDQLRGYIERFVDCEEMGADEFTRSVDAALQLLASIYAFGSDNGSNSGNLRILTLDLDMHFDILSRLTMLARENLSMYGIIFRHFSQLSRKLVQSQLLTLTQCVARILQRLCIDGQDASTLYTNLAHENNFELFGEMVKTLPPSMWQHVMPRRPGVLSPSLAGMNQNRLTLADRLLHRLAGVLRRSADVLTGESGRNVAASLMRRTEEDEIILSSVLILLKSMRHLHGASTKCSSETMETSILAVNWWLYNGLNADLAHDGLMLLKTSNGSRLADTLLSQGLNEMTARNLQRLTRLFAASEGLLLSELIKTSLDLLDPDRDSVVEAAYLEAFACVMKLWAQRLDSAKTAWQYGHRVRKSLAACQRTIRFVAAGVGEDALRPENLIVPRTVEAGQASSEKNNEEVKVGRDLHDGASENCDLNGASSLMSNTQKSKLPRSDYSMSHGAPEAMVDSNDRSVEFNPDLNSRVYDDQEDEDLDEREEDDDDEGEPFEVYDGGEGAADNQANSEENELTWG